MPAVLKSHTRNLDFSQTEDFVPWAIATLRVRSVRVMRIHVAGDFFDDAYVRRWTAIVKACPDVTFYAYTRSWRLGEMFPELIRLGQLPNMHLWWSMDRSTGRPPLIRGIRCAYMAINDADAATAPDDVDLVFRDDDKTVMKKANGVQVCPPENGVATSPAITCSRCGICWKPKTTAWESVLLPYIEPAGGDEFELFAPDVTP